MTGPPPQKAAEALEVMYAMKKGKVKNRRVYAL